MPSTKTGGHRTGNSWREPAGEIISLSPPIVHVSPMIYPTSHSFFVSSVLSTARRPYPRSNHGQ